LFEAGSAPNVKDIRLASATELDIAFMGYKNMHQISIQEAESHISSVFSDVLRGEEIVLTDHDMPVMKMTPIMQPNGANRLKFGSLKGKIWISDDFNDTPEEFADYM